MSESQCWEIDRMAARRLIGRLGVAATPETVEEVAAEFASHRLEVEQWVADRVQSYVIGMLEARSIEEFGRMDERWSDGFRTAEELVARLQSEDLLGQPVSEAKSKGQLLRSMMRTARKRSALVEKRSR